MTVSAPAQLRFLVSQAEPLPVEDELLPVAFEKAL
jgi:hypothetical protein